MEEIRNELGYPLKDDGTIDWKATNKEKQEISDNFDYSGFVSCKKHRNKMTHLKSKKKKRK
jgi:hypothetical protein